MMMNEQEAAQFRRYVLNIIQMEGGQASWKRLHEPELIELNKMEAEGIIERVPSENSGFAYRVPVQTRA